MEVRFLANMEVRFRANMEVRFLANTEVHFLTNTKNHFLMNTDGSCLPRIQFSFNGEIRSFVEVHPLHLSHFFFAYKLHKEVFK